MRGWQVPSNRTVTLNLFQGPSFGLTGQTVIGANLAFGCSPVITETSAKWTLKQVQDDEKWKEVV